MNLPCQNRRFVNDQSEPKLYEWAETENFMNEQKPKICEWSSWIESFMNEQKPKVYELSNWTEGFMNKPCQNRRFVDYQAEPKRFSSEGF